MMETTIFSKVGGDVTLATPAAAAGTRVLPLYPGADNVEAGLFGKVNGFLVHDGVEAARELRNVGYPGVGGDLAGKAGGSEGGSLLVCRAAEGLAVPETPADVL
ncbi:hypothetical protein VDBG_07938 [Verticillium alfalfae VaMs.102]|uniref:Uncharacterized protein n=1 Tax=Verticillium alfalfae (strain VaMs.102 / ATCC MYA-4576 / FGSC 10136) TaxID=526221 RepID=C9SSR3_VERA1|nr:hypothetical protein VDBG_07938 [Verticillium alfalfae VaMs.102]EEY21828.1 hypothetical protein VDBG_07938 [Verticillium alfalfae VaMs.102]